MPWEPSKTDGSGAMLVAPASRTSWRWLIILVASLAVLASIGLLVRFRGSSSMPQNPDLIWADGERALRSGQLERARSTLAKIDQSRIRTALDWMLDAQLAIAEKQHERAFTTLAKISDDHPIASQAHLLAGRLRRQRGLLREAEAEFRRAIELKPALIEAHRELIYILGIQSRRPEVDAEFHALARLTTLSHHDLFTWSLTHFTHWNPDIVNDLDAFIKADPEDRLSRLAVVELLLDRPGEEVDAYISRTLEPLPSEDLDALALRVRFAFNRGRFEEAERLMAAAPENHVRLARIRGEMALRRRDIDAAIRNFKQALSQEPYDRASPMHLAQALKLKGDTAAAQVYIDRVERLNKVYNQIVRVRSPSRQNQISDLAELGKACEDAGLRDEARGWYTLAITVSPLDADAQRGLARVSPPNPTPAAGGEPLRTDAR